MNHEYGEQQDPNEEREDVPFPTQHGPPRFPQQSYQGQGAPQQVVRPPDQPYRGNGHGISYATPPFMQTQAVAQQSQPYQPPPSGLVENLQMIRLAAEAGAFEVAQIWAEQIQVFKANYQGRNGALLTDREAFDMIVGPLVMAIEG